MFFQNKIQLLIQTPIHVNTIHFFFNLSSLLLKNKLTKLKINLLVLPKSIKKFSVLKSPHVHKTSFSQFESRQLKKNLTVTNFKTIKNMNLYIYLSKHFIKNLITSTKIILKKIQLIRI